MRRKKALKQGGVNFNITGPFLEKKLYDEYNKGKLGDIKNIYDENLKQKEIEIEKINKDLKDLEVVRNNSEGLNLKLLEINNRKEIEDTKNNLEINKQLYNVFVRDMFGGLFTNFKSFASTAGSSLLNVAKLAAFGGEGILFKVIIIFIVISIIIMIIFGISYGILNTGDFSTSNDISKRIMLSDNELNIMDPKNMSFMTKLMNRIKGIIPNEYLYKLNSISNSLTYLVSGKNQYDDFLIDRNEIITGRSDNLIHFSKLTTDGYKLESNLKNNTVSLYKPKGITIDFKNVYANVDYNNIPNELINNINYPNKITIDYKPDTIDNRSKYILDVDSQKYYYDDDLKTKIDKRYYVFIKDKNNIKLNSFDNINYTKISNVIAMYSPILINKDYKGVIMTIQTIDNNKKIKYLNIYYNDVLKKYYYYENNIIKYDELKDINILYNIIRLYDQSNNGYDYIFDNGNDMDDKYPPILVFKHNEYLIEFFSRAILYLNNKKYPNKKALIKANIKIYNNNFIEVSENGIIKYKNTEIIDDEYDINYVVNYMDLLASKSESIIILKLTDDKNSKYKYKIENIIDKNLNNIEYDGKEKEMINININDLSKIECLGVAHDVRDDLQKRTKTIKERRDNHIREHGFIGHIYNLIIYNN